MQPILDAFDGLNVDDGRDQNSESGSSPVPLLVPVQGNSGLTLQKFLPYLKKMSPGQPTEGRVHSFTHSFGHLTLTMLLSLSPSIPPFSPKCVTEVLKVLNDLDETSQHSPGIITHFVVCNGMYGVCGSGAAGVGW